jgi:DNA-binding GntR family transcriptional regulator
MTPTQVCELRLDGFRDVETVRALLESRLLHHSANAPAHTVRRLRETVVALRERLSAGDVAAALARDRDFSLTVVTMSGKPLLTDLWCQASDRLAPYRALVLSAPGSASRIPAEHEQVVRVLERAGPHRPDVEELLALWTAHSAADEQLLRRLLDPHTSRPAARSR